MTYKERDKDKKQLIEQYKLYVEMADRVSSRRIQVSKFYVSLLSGLLALLSILPNIIKLEYIILVFIPISIISIILCIVWYKNIQSYKQLNAAKYKLINEIEKSLPFQYYTKEWEELKSKNYTEITTIEKYVPLIFASLYPTILSIYCLLNN